MNSISKSEEFALDRRAFLKGGAAGLVVCFTLGLEQAKAQTASAAMVGAYIQIAPDNSVTVYIGASEMGQGIMTGMAQLVAEELYLDWSQVKTVHAPAAAAYANPLFHSQATGGSTSMRAWFMPLRTAAAIAREMLRRAGAAALGADPSVCVLASGMVAAGSRTVSYGQIASAAALLPAPAANSVALVSNFAIIGKSLPRTDIPAKVNGSAIYGIDVRLPNMAYGAVVHCPVQGGTVGSMPATPRAAKAIVNLGNAVGVVAGNSWQAMSLANGLAVQWSIPDTALAVGTPSMLSNSQTLLASGTGQAVESAGNPDSGVAAGGKSIDVTYQLPYLAHACMEVLNCTVAIGNGTCEIWAPTQAQSACVATAQSILGANVAVTVHTTYLGGGLGRKFEQDFITQAIKLAQAAGVPVKLTWSRTQDFRNDRYRPSALIRVRAGLAADGSVSGLIYRNVSPSVVLQRKNIVQGEDPGALAGALGLPYALPNRRIEYVPDPAPIPVGYWRSVGESYNTFAVESAIDELAIAGGLDPLAFRRGLLAGNSRALAVLDAVAALSNWSAKPAAGHARGLAFLSGFGSLIAHVADVSLNSQGTIRVNTVYCAVDCGTAVNPDAIEAQVQGGIAHGLSAALWGQVTFTKGAAQVTNFSDYRMLRMGEMPVVKVQIVNSGGPIGGIGETAVPCVAPAIANAYAKLTGIRQRSLPFYPGSGRGGQTPSSGGGTGSGGGTASTAGKGSGSSSTTGPSNRDD